MDNHPNNIRLFLKRLRARLRGQEVAARFPVEEGWQRLRERIESEEVVPMRARVFRMRTGYAAAVVLILLAGGGYWWWRSERGQGGVNLRLAGVEKAVLPPSKGVQLVLSDGRRVSVDRARTLNEAGGVAIQTDSGSVDYQVGVGGKAGELAYNTLEVPRGNKTRVTLPDGTKVWINAASKLMYPTVFVGETREVVLEGEAYFDVSKDGAHPFIVHARGMDIRVLGTAFNVNTYESSFYTTLVSGKVSVKGKAAGLTLEPGEQAVMNSENGAATKGAVNVGDYTGWKDNDLYIGNLSLAQVVVMLGRQFDYDIVVADAGLEKLHFTVDMPAPASLQEVLDHICSTTEGIRFSISGRRVTVSRTE